MTRLACFIHDRLLILFVLLLLLPILSSILVLYFFVPHSFILSYSTKCTKTDVSELAQCSPTPNETDRQKILLDIREQLDTADRLSFLAKPFNAVIRLSNEKITNVTVARLEISEPKQSEEKQVQVACNIRPQITDIFSYNAGIISPLIPSIKPEKIPEQIATTYNFLTACVPTNAVFDGKGRTVAPNATVTMSLEPKYKIEFLSDTKSKIIIYLETLLLWMLALPIFREVYRFVSKGVRYFK